MLGTRMSYCCLYQEYQLLYGRIVVRFLPLFANTSLYEYEYKVYEYFFPDVLRASAPVQVFCTPSTKYHTAILPSTIV